MAKKRSQRPRRTTRSKPHSYARGILETNIQGYGFVKTAEGEYFIPRSKMNGAFDGDLVEISPLSKRQDKGAKARGRLRQEQGERRASARIVRVLDHSHASLTGRFEVAPPFGVVVPDDPRIPYDIFTLLSENPDIPDGSLVRVSIKEYPTRRSSATGTIEEVLGNYDDDTLLSERIIARNDLEVHFSEEAWQEAEEATLDIAAALRSGYRDIRDRFIFTIDPADAKDFDDALSLEEMDPEVLSSVDLFAGVDLSLAQGESQRGMAHERIWRLGVHIADVSCYVPWGSAIDLDARKRATSVYLADRVIPMIPPKLSDDLCSLRPGQDRLCMSVDLYVDDRAELVAYDLYPAVMTSAARLSYREALELLEEAPRQRSTFEERLGSQGMLERLREKVHRASRIAQARQRLRKGLGGIEFETKEAKVVLEGGRPVAIEVRQKDEATQLIEEAMIFANEVVATHLEDHGWPCVYRVHERPAPDALAGLIPPLQEFSWFKRSLGAGLKVGDPQAFQRILDACAGRPEADMVTMLMLRTMMRALYTPNNEGHYGLGLRTYCHFTSPIRRYPDLIVHRMLKASLTKRPERFDQEVSALKGLCEHASEMERKAEHAAFESQKAMIAWYMEAFIGHEFNGVVSGVTTYGLYVRLENCAEGLIPIRSLGSEYFAFDPVRSILRGTDSGTTYRLGQPLRVRLSVVDRAAAHLDLVLIGEES